MQTGDVDGDVADGIDGSARRSSERENGRVGGACRSALSPSPAGDSRSVPRRKPRPSATSSQLFQRVIKIDIFVALCNLSV